MTDSGAGVLSNERVVEQAPLGVTPAPWEHLSKAERDAVERATGHQPGGYRGTGPVEWWTRRHPDTADCCLCGTVTGRWVAVAVKVAFVAHGTPHVNQRMEQRDKKQALCWDPQPYCPECQRAEDIAVLERRQQNVAISPELREREALYLAELIA